MTTSRRGPARMPAGSRRGHLRRQGRSGPAVTPSVIKGIRPGDAGGGGDSLEPQGLTATFIFDSGHAPRPYSATVRFHGQRAGVSGRPGPGDSFVQEESVATVLPDSGPVSVTARVLGINAGEWSVAAELLAPPISPGKPGSQLRTGHGGERHLEAATWSWRRWALAPGPAAPLKTRWVRLIGFDRMPAVVPGSWLGLVTLGVVIGFVFQAQLLPREHLAVGTVLPISLLAVVSGVVGGKVWYIALNRRTWRATPQDGWCIQGALVGATAVGVVAVALLHLPVGVLLDTTAPGLFLGVAVGRLGCFFTGCCAGRLTASRLGVWCSDRRVGARRIPAQLLESFAALCVGLLGLYLVLRYQLRVAGAVFVASMSAYTLCRQLNLLLREEHRRSAIGGPLTAVVATLVLAASVVWLVLSAH